MARVNYAQGVRKEIDDAIDYYEDARVGLGLEFLVEIEKAVEKLAMSPLRYRPVRSIFRRCLVNRFPYAIIFSHEIRTDHINIVAVMHMSRKPDYWLQRSKGGE